MVKLNIDENITYLYLTLVVLEYSSAISQSKNFPIPLYAKKNTHSKGYQLVKF